MSEYTYNPSVIGVWLTFDPDSGQLEMQDDSYLTVSLPKREAINLASKLLQWGTSS